MTRVFLSYAEEDAAGAGRLATRLTAAGFDVFWWQDPNRRGQRFVEEIDNQIRRADLFVVLASPHYFASEWCRNERDQATVRQRAQSTQFIYVVNLGNVDIATTGSLSTIDWLDLTEPIDDGKIDAIVAVLSGAGTASDPDPVFRNRDDELDAILNALTTTGGNDTWLVVSPPRMGKSWFLNRLRTEMTNRGSTVRLVDLRQKPAKLRTDATGLLTELLGLNGTRPNDPCPLAPATRSAIATEINRRRSHEICLLDSADLLDPRCAANLRSELTDVYGKLRSMPNRASRLSVILGSRANDDWKGYGRDPASGVRFKPMALTEFSVDIVHQALAKLSLIVDGGKLWDYAKRLHQLSEGLPALLVRSLEWAEDTGFMELEDSPRQSTFDTVARPYIRDDLLAEESLLPFGADDPGRAKSLLERTLRVLVAYRLFTQSHLRFHVETDAGFKAELDAANWTLVDLWQAVSRTAILKRPLEEPWQVIHPPIRRLLYRYYYDTDEAQAHAHAQARRFYEGWTDRNAYKEQGVVLVECLWHEAARMLIERREDLHTALPPMARQLAGEFLKSPIYEPEEFSDFVARWLDNDEEFQLCLQDVDGLFDEILRSVTDAMRGGA